MVDVNEGASSAPTGETQESSQVEGTENTQESTESVDAAQGGQATSKEAADKAALEKKAKTQTLSKQEKKYLKSLKLKVDGREYEESLPFELPDDPRAVEYMTRQLQMSKMGQKRAQEYSGLQKDVVNFINKLRSNPREALSDPNIGIDVKKLAAEIIEEEIKNAQKSPEQLEKEKLEQEVRRLKEEQELERQQMQQREFERLQEQEFVRYDTKISSALEHSDLPKSPYVVKKMADYLSVALQNNISLEPEDVLPLVREEIVEDLKQMFAVMPTDVIEAMVGKDKLGQLRKKTLAAAKPKPPVPLKDSVKDTGKVSDKKDSNAGAKKLTYKEMFGF